MALRQSAGDLLGTLGSMLQTRFELFSLEAAGQREHLTRSLALMLVGGLLLTLALLVFSLTIALLFWPTEYRYWALGVLTLVYAISGAWILLRVRKSFLEQPAPFSATLEELRMDLALLDKLRSSSDDDDDADNKQEASHGH